MFFGADRIRRVVAHLHDLFGVYKFHLRVIAQSGFFEIKGEFLLMSDQNELKSGDFLQGEQDALNDDSGRIVSAHCINGDLHNDPLLRGQITVRR